MSDGWQIWLARKQFELNCLYSVQIEFPELRFHDPWDEMDAAESALREGTDE